MPFERVLFALGIRFVGETVAKTVAKSFKSMDALADASLDNLIHVDEIGEKIAQSILLYFANPKNRDIKMCIRDRSIPLKWPHRIIKFFASESESAIGWLN